MIIILVNMLPLKLELIHLFNEIIHRQIFLMFLFLFKNKIIIILYPRISTKILIAGILLKHIKKLLRLSQIELPISK